MKVELIRKPSGDDWAWVKTCALNTVGLKAVNAPTEEWKQKLLESEHSPMRELWFGFRLEIPYWVSVHLVRHHDGINHYVRSQRDDRQRTESVPRAEKPQGEIVEHIISVNAQELVYIAHKRLCNQASKETREVVRAMCDLVIAEYPEFKSVLVPLCEYRNGKCTEFNPCGRCEYGI